MNKKKPTRLEIILSTSFKDGMITHMRTYPEDFEELLSLILENKKEYAWRASWLMWSCMMPNDPRLQPYTSQLIDLLPERPDNQVRELFKILEGMDLHENEEGQLFEHATHFWLKVSKQASVRYRAFNFMVKMVKKYPELKEELKTLTEPFLLDSLSPGVKKSILKNLRQLDIS